MQFYSTTDIIFLLSVFTDDDLIRNTVLGIHEFFVQDQLHLQDGVVHFSLSVDGLSLCVSPGTCKTCVFMMLPYVMPHVLHSGILKSSQIC